jgi:peroxiredoxin
MAARVAPVCAFGTPAPDFALPDTVGRVWSRDALRGPSGLVLMFICNHCPYVLAIVDKIAAEALALRAIGFGVAAVCSNDSVGYPADGFDQMGAFARRHGLEFPYLHDADQSLARACDAACTPEFFGYDAALGLQYRGRLDDSGRSPRPGARRELFEAMRLVVETGAGPRDQTAAMGCSIKWTRA